MGDSFVGVDNFGAKGTTGRQGMQPVGQGMFVATAKPLPQEVYLPPLPAGAVIDEYPKMMLHPEFVDAQRIFKEMPVETKADQKARDQAAVKMRQASCLVHNMDEEEEKLLDGWRPSVADLLVDRGEADPRIPVGAEAARAKKAAQQTIEQELLALRRRYLILTGVRLEEAALMEMGTPDPGPAPQSELETADAQLETAQPTTAPTRTAKPAATRPRARARS